MKILVLSDIEAGGEWIATQTLIEKLKKKDKSFRFYLVTSSKNKYLLKKSLFEEIFLTKSKKHHLILKYYRDIFFKIFSGKRIISSIYRRYKIDRVITTNYILAISYLISRLNTRYIFLFHGIRNNYKIFFYAFDDYMFFQKFLEILSWILSSKLIIPSISVKKVLIEHSFSLLKYKNTIIIPNLVRDEFINNNLKTVKQKIILYSGRLASMKGIENLIKAFLQITKRYSKVFLMIAYPGKPQVKFFKKIKAIAREESRIKFINNSSVHELSALYRSSSLAVLPSPFEISSLFIREALMCNLPILSTKTGDANKILTEPFILKDNKIETIQTKIINFLKNTDLYQKIFLKITNKFKSQYNEERIISDWLSLLKNT